MSRRRGRDRLKLRPPRHPPASAGPPAASVEVAPGQPRALEDAARWAEQERVSPTPKLPRTR